MSDLVKWGETHQAKRTDWRFGSPPCKGWWETQLHGSWTARRYWNGECWSHFVNYSTDAQMFAAMLKKSQFGTDEIEWRGLDRPSEEGLFRGRFRRAVQQAMKGNQ